MRAWEAIVQKRINIINIDIEQYSVLIEYSTVLE